MAVIAIDMTPMFPGGENGGAKLLALELIKGFQSSSGDNKFLILTASWNDQELACFDSSNTQRLCILKKDSPKAESSLPFLGVVELGLRKLYRSIKWQYSKQIHSHGPLHENGVDVLLCPFAAPTYAEHGIPVVSVICDLQHKDYPQFFSDQEIRAREFFLGEVKSKADAIICISESTKKSVIHHLNTNPDKTFVIHICIQSRLARNDRSTVKRHLHDLRIDRRQYMFYPANFWPHKNHQMLITAYGMYVARNPKSKIDLVFTGSLDAAQQNVQDKITRMGLDKRIHFLGYLPEEQLTSVWQGCSFLIFPSLYEGFGIPVLEAMQFGKPVLCSNVTSLPEVAGDTALYFDPRKPADIVNCIEKITSDETLYSDLVQRGKGRLAHFQPEEMIKKYLQVIEKVAGYPRKFHDEVKGIYADGWTGDRLDITYNHEQLGRILELKMELPPWYPYRQSAISLNGHSKMKRKWKIRRGQSLEIKLPLIDKENHLAFAIEPTFIPAEYNITPDNRALGVLCQRCGLISPNGEYKLLWPGK